MSRMLDDPAPQGDRFFVYPTRLAPVGSISIAVNPYSLRRSPPDRGARRRLHPGGKGPAELIAYRPGRPISSFPLCSDSWPAARRSRHTRLTIACDQFAHYGLLSRRGCWRPKRFENGRPDQTATSGLQIPVYRL